MNLIILDACRDNPFGVDLPVQKGLSQIDAPPGTLLAYATAPGNTAADGFGANSIYTENMLKEMQVPAATEYQFKVVGREKITVPAGEFDAFRVEGNGMTSQGALLKYTYWIAPDRVRRPLATEFVSQGSKTGKLFVDDRHELVSFRQQRETR